MQHLEISLTYAENDSNFSAKVLLNITTCIKGALGGLARHFLEEILPVLLFTTAITLCKIGSLAILKVRPDGDKRVSHKLD